MGYYPTKIRAVDRLFSKYIREKAGKCEMCGRSDIKLECSHYHGRRKESVRFDEFNCWCLCYNCHKKTHEDKSFYDDWLLDKIGQKEFDLLALRANTTGKKDDKMTMIVVKEMIKELENISNL